MITVEAAVDSKTKGLVGSTLLGVPSRFGLNSFDFLGLVLISGCVENMSLYRTSLYVTGDATIAETVRVAGVLMTSVAVGVVGSSRG